MTTLINVNTNPSRRLLVPIVRCQIGEDVFLSGDGSLRSASVSLGEGERSSRCSFEIYDPDQRWAQKYLQASYEQGGLNSIGGGAPAAPGAAPTTIGATSGAPTSGAVVGNAAACEEAIVRECLRQGITDDNQIAYILGTAKHESANYATLTEYASGSQYEGRRDLGNVQAGDGQRFKGRGFVQVTGRSNYQKYSKILGKDFVANPQAMAAPDVSTFTLVHGMKTGTFTGARLDQYVGNGKADFYGARRTVNGTDRADLISGYAQNYKPKVAQLKQKVGGQTKPPVVAPPPKTEETPPVEIADKGCQIIISMGYQMDQMTHFTFIHQGTKFSGVDLNLTSFEGQSVRWLMTRRTKNSTYQNITLKQLAEKVAKSYGLTLEMKGDGPKFEFLDQTGITDYQLLQRECDRIGYRLYDQGKKLIIQSRGDIPLGFVLQYGVNMDSFEVHDQAQSDTGAGQAAMPTGDTATAAQPAESNATPTAETKTTLNPLTGQLDQKKKENKAASGLAGNSPPVAITGAAKPPIAPKLAQEPKKEEPKADTKGGQNAAAKASKAGEEVQNAEAPATEPDMQASASGAARVKGFPGSASFTTTEAALMITPDVPFISDGFEADFLNRVWSVDTVNHDYKGGGLKTTIRFYTPMAPKPGAAIAAAPGATATPGAPGAAQVQPTSGNPGKLANPMPGTPRGTPFDPAGRIRGRPHTGIDMSGGGGKPILASADGVVTHSGSKGGYGLSVEIKHNGSFAGWDTFYAHLRSLSVKMGQQVKRGQVVGLEGNTGASFGDHLHYEVRKGGAYVDPEVWICPPPSGTYGQGAGTPIRSRC
jgi:murein DD-endopeptidase MepM/ murein hydrolase activator NlpD